MILPAPESWHQAQSGLCPVVCFSSTHPWAKKRILFQKKNIVVNSGHYLEMLNFQITHWVRDLLAATSWQLIETEEGSAGRCFYEFSTSGLIPAGLFPGSSTPAEPLSVCLSRSQPSCRVGDLPGLQQTSSSLRRRRRRSLGAAELPTPLPFRAGTPRSATAPAAQRGCRHVPEVTAGGWSQTASF